MSASYTDLTAAAAETIRKESRVGQFDLAVTLGSGWKSAADHLGETISTINAAIVPGFRSSAVEGHSGTLSVVRTPGGAHILVIGARTHYYEGHGIDAVVHGVRTAAALGAKVMVLTNGAGGINPDWTAGQAVLIADHLNLTARSPLAGAEFVDLTDLYARRLRAIARSIDPSIQEGVYAQLPGPHYETPAEVRMLRTIGADIVGMSTALEAIAARACGLEVLGLSLITNLAAGVQDTPLNHEEVLEAGALAETHLGPFLARILDGIVFDRHGWQSDN